MLSEMPQILQTLVREHGGAKLLADANLCRGLLNEHGLKHHLLKDKYLTERLREVNLLVSAIEEGVAAELMAGPLDAARRRQLAQRLCDRHDFDQGEASWTVETWVAAFSRKPARAPRSFTDLARRVAAARPGSTLELAPGEYLLSEQLVIAKSLTLRGAGQDNTSIVMRASTKNAMIFLNSACELVLERLTIRQTGKAPTDVIWLNAGTTTIRQCTISGGILDTASNKWGAGIRIAVSACCSVVDSVLQGNEESGILLCGSGQGVILNNLCCENRHGIAAIGQSTLKAEGNNCRNNRDCGIILEGSSRGTLVNNQCNDNLHFGVVAQGHADLTAKANHCLNNEYGFNLCESCQVNIIGNQCQANAKSGISAGGNVTLTAEDNSCRNNSECGIILGGNCQGKAINNHCDDNSHSGIRAQGNSSLTAERNSCQHNQESGIILAENSQGAVVNNSCRQNGKQGISTTGNATVRAENNNCQQNQDCGIAFFDNAKGTHIEKNTCIGNKYGIYTATDTAVTLLQNNCSGNSTQDICSMAKGLAAGESVQVLSKGDDLTQRVAAAKPGSTLELAPGEYLLSEQLVITKSLTLRGAGQDNTSIVMRATTNNAVIYLNSACELVLERLTIRQTGKAPTDVIWLNAGTTTIRQCTISGGIHDTASNQWGAGLRITGSAYCAVVDSILQGNEESGILLTRSAPGSRTE